MNMIVLVLMMAVTVFYAALGVNFNVAWLGIALTGIFASRGANYVSDLVKKLQALGAAKTE